MRCLCTAIGMAKMRKTDEYHEGSTVPNVLCVYLKLDTILLPTVCHG